jgi:hypothetical protein
MFSPLENGFPLSPDPISPFRYGGRKLHDENRKLHAKINRSTHPIQNIRLDRIKKCSFSKRMCVTAVLLSCLCLVLFSEKRKKERFDWLLSIPSSFLRDCSILFCLENRAYFLEGGEKNLPLENKFSILGLFLVPIETAI